MGAWRKATHSTATGACVEVAPTADGVLVRHSNQPDGAVVAYSRAEWCAFLSGVKAGEFDDLVDRPPA